MRDILEIYILNIFHHLRACRLLYRDAYNCIFSAKWGLLSYGLFIAVFDLPRLSFSSLATRFHVTRLLANIMPTHRRLTRDTFFPKDHRHTLFICAPSARLASSRQNSIDISSLYSSRRMLKEKKKKQMAFRVRHGATMPLSVNGGWHNSVAMSRHYATSNAIVYSW